MHNGFRFASSNWIIALRSTAIVLVAWNHGQAYGHVLSAISRSPFLVRSCFVDATCDPVSFADFIHGSTHKRAHVYSASVKVHSSNSRLYTTYAI